MAADEDPPLYYIAVEASYSIDDEDIARATDHAKIVHAITGLTAYAVVAGVRLDDEITDDARSKVCEEVTQYAEADSDPDFVYWHRLESSDLRPPEPLAIGALRSYRHKPPQGIQPAGAFSLPRTSNPEPWLGTCPSRRERDRLTTNEQLQKGTT